MSKNPTVNYTDEQFELAKQMYLAYKPLADIVAKSGMNIHTVKYHVGKRWKEEREFKKSEIVEALTESKKSLMYEISKHGLEILANSIKDLSSSKRPLNPTEMSRIKDIITDLDKIVKLDEGNPTEILADTRPATIVEVRELLKKDPFLELEEAEVVEENINDDKTSESNS